MRRAWPRLVARRSGSGLVAADSPHGPPGTAQTWPGTSAPGASVGKAHPRFSAYMSDMQINVLSIPQRRVYG